MLLDTETGLLAADVATGDEVILGPLGGGRPWIEASAHTAWWWKDDGAVVIRRDGGRTTSAPFADRVEAVSPDARHALVRCLLDERAWCVGELAAERVRRQRPIALPGHPLGWGEVGLIVEHTLDETERGLRVVDPATGDAGPRMALSGYPEAVSADGARFAIVGAHTDARGDALAISIVIGRFVEPSGRQPVVPVGTVRIDGRRDANCVFAADSAGTLVCVSGAAPSGPHALIAVVPDRPTRTLLDGLASPDLVLSPDGQFAAVRRPIGEQDQLVVVELATGRATDVGEPGPLRSPVAWLTDGAGPPPTPAVTWPDALPPARTAAPPLAELRAPVRVPYADMGAPDVLVDAEVRAPLDALLAWAQADGGLAPAGCELPRFDPDAVRYAAALALRTAAPELDHPHVLAVFYLARRLVADAVGVDERLAAADVLDELRTWATERRLELPAAFARVTWPDDALAAAVLTATGCLRAEYERLAPRLEHDFGRADVQATLALFDALDAAARAHLRDRAALVAEVTRIASAAVADAAKRTRVRLHNTTYTAERLRGEIAGLARRLDGVPAGGEPP